MKENHMQKKQSKIEKVEQHFTQVKHSFSVIKEQEKALQSLADKMSLLVSSDDELISRYKENLLAFKEYHPEIFSFFEKFEPQKYIVDAKDGFVNAINVENGNYFYQYPSYLSTKLQFDEFIKSPNIKKFNFNSKDEDEANFLHVNTMDAMMEFLPNEQECLHRKSTLPVNSFSSLVIFGVGAGYHLELFSQNFDMNCLYIVEPDADLFFLSLFSINWQYVLSTLDNKGCMVHISLGAEKGTFIDDLMNQVEHHGQFQMAHVAGFIHYQSAQISELLTSFNHRYLEFGRGWGFFDDAVMAIGHTLKNINNKVPLLKKSALHNSVTSQVPVFIVGNGPSLDTLIDAIKNCQDKAVIISCGSALSALYKYGIKPDFHCEQERTFPVAEKIEHSCPASFLDDIVLLAPTTVHPAVFSMFEKSIMAPKANEPSSDLLLRDKELGDLFNAYHFINPTVANTALVMGYNLGFKNFYLFGIDLGHKVGGNHHSKKSLYYSEDGQDIELYKVNHETAIEVEGNFGGQFICDSFFYTSNTSLSKQILAFDDLVCFNLSNGAAINGSTAMLIENLVKVFDNRSVINKKDIESNILSHSIYCDEGSLFKRLVLDLDYEYFDEVCQRLATLNSKPVSTFKEANELLLNQTIVLGTLTGHAKSLLQGSIRHMQVVLLQLLYGSSDEPSAVEVFNKGLVLYAQFIVKTAEYYRENAEQAHYVEDSKFVVKLRNK